MPNRLMDLSHFAPIFEPLRGKRVVLTEGVGWNPGDVILYQATRQLCDEFEISYTRNDYREAQHVFLFAGGNVIGPYVNETRERYDALVKAYKQGLPMTLLPQSIWFPLRQHYSEQSPPNIPCECLYPVERIFARERVSLLNCSRAQLAPDLALGYVFPDEPENNGLRRYAVRHVIRRDLEGVVAKQLGKTGTKEQIRWKNWIHFLSVARSADHVYTDRLHIAIAAMAYGRRVTLIGNSYHKNASMFDTWLQTLGCEYLTPAEYIRKFRPEEIFHDD